MQTSTTITCSACDTFEQVEVEAKEGAPGGVKAWVRVPLCWIALTKVEKINTNEREVVHVYDRDRSDGSYFPYMIFYLCPACVPTLNNALSAKTSDKV